jgi:hypothetical protein
VELLKEVAPRITRIALVFNPDTAPGGGSYFLRPFEAAAPSFAAKPIAAPVHDAVEIEGAVFRRLAGARPQADLDWGPHHPRQDIEAWQSLPARPVRPAAWVVLIKPKS